MLPVARRAIIMYTQFFFLFFPSFFFFSRAKGPFATVPLLLYCNALYRKHEAVTRRRSARAYARRECNRVVAKLVNIVSRTCGTVSWHGFRKLYRHVFLLIIVIFFFVPSSPRWHDIRFAKLREVC